MLQKLQGITCPVYKQSCLESSRSIYQPVIFSWCQEGGSKNRDNAPCKKEFVLVLTAHSYQHIDPLGKLPVSCWVTNWQDCKKEVTCPPPAREGMDPKLGQLPSIFLDFKFGIERHVNGSTSRRQACLFPLALSEPHLNICTLHLPSSPCPVITSAPWPWFILHLSLFGLARPDTLGSNELALLFIYTTMLFVDFPGGSGVKNLPANAADTGSIPGLRRSPGEGTGKPLQYSCLGNPMNREAWRATVHGIARESDMM